jgi:hypothetical protein
MHTEAPESIINKELSEAMLVKHPEGAMMEILQLSEHELALR